MFKKVFGLLFSSLLLSMPVNAGVAKLSGPRLGVTALTTGMASEELGSNFISQYGWQFETRFSDSEELAALAEWIILAGGMEQGYFLPSITSLVGLRRAEGFEFGVGPNLSITGIGFVVASGYNFKVGNVNLPVNISWVPSNKSSWHNDEVTGHRISLTCGFNMSKGFNQKRRKYDL